MSMQNPNNVVNYRKADKIEDVLMKVHSGCRKMNNSELEQRIASKQQENELFVRVAEMYKAGMIRSKITRQNKIEEDVVKRILISLNLMETEYSARIIPLMRSGMSKKTDCKISKN